MIKINGSCIHKAELGAGIVNYQRHYTAPTGLELVERKTLQRESDYENGTFLRRSADNGRTFGEWVSEKKEEYTQSFGEDELITDDMPRVWNPVHKHFVFTRFTRYFLEGHKAAYQKFWKNGERTFFDHQYICIANGGESEPASVKLIRYERGVDFSSEQPRNFEFLEKNCGFLNAPTVLSNGDIAVPVGVPISKLCELYGIDTESLFPSCPTIHRGVLVARGRFSPEREEYDFTFSNPVLLSDMQSSRGIDEPIVTELTSGRLLLVMRGSNVISENWHTRIKEGTPSYKWYSYSDDGGITFAAPQPWKNDSGEPIYSSATISTFIRSSKNGKLYWIGNITDKSAYGNFPRFPLYIAEVDEVSGLLKKETLTVIDTRREGESEKLQLSNFNIIENRETLNFELTLAKLGQFDENNPFYGESWRYEIII